MSVQSEITRITNAKAAIKTAIEGKGVTVPEGTLLDGMAALIDSIEAGGSGGKAYKIVSGYLYSTSTDTDGSFTLAHNLGCTTVLFMMMRPATFSFNNGEIGCALYVNPDADESIAPEFNWETYRKKFQAIVRCNDNFFVFVLTGTADNNSISFSRYKNGRFTAEVTGRYFWLAVGVEGA